MMTYLLLACALVQAPACPGPTCPTRPQAAAVAVATRGSYLSADGRMVDWQNGPQGFVWTVRQAPLAPTVPAIVAAPAVAAVAAPTPTANYGVDLSDVSAQAGTIETNDPQLGSILEPTAPQAATALLPKPQVNVEVDLMTPAWILGGAFILAVLLAKRTSR